MRPAEYWMDQAITLAEKAGRLDEVPVGAVIVKDDELVAVGFNQTISANDPTAHAEIVALRAASLAIGNYRLSDMDLYVTIEPCTMCAGALVHARIRNLFYGASEPRAGAIVSSARVLDNPGLNHQVAVTGGVCEQRASSLISDFFKAKRTRGDKPCC